MTTPIGPTGSTRPIEPIGPASTVMLAVTGMHCASCGLLIDDAVEELPGVISSTTDTRTERTTITTPTTMNSHQLADLIDQAATAISDLGYHAEPVTT